MDWLNFSGSVASLIGLVVSIYTLYKVETLPGALKRQSRDQQLIDLIDQIVNSPSPKPRISESTARDVEFLLQTIRTYYVSRFSLRGRSLKIQLTSIETEIAGPRRREIVKNQLQLIRHEIAIR